MKNSAWYNKLWRKKLHNLPVKEDPGLAWTAMKELLDQHLPVKHLPASADVKSFGAKLISFMTYLVPAAAMIGGIAYFALIHSPDKQKTYKKQRLQHSKQLNKQYDTIPSYDSFPTAAGYQNKHPDIGGAMPDRYPGALTTLTPGIAQDHLTPGNSTETLAWRSNGNSYRPGGYDRKNAMIRPASDLPLIPLQKLSINDFNLFINSYLNNHKTIPDPIIEMLEAGNNKDQGLAEKWLAKPDLRNNSRRDKEARQKREMITPSYNFLLEAGLNTGKGNGLYFGASGSYALNKRWLLNAGISFSTGRAVSGGYAHPSYYKPDSLPPFGIKDSRKVLAMDIPLTMEFRISNSISIKAGPLFSIPVKQSKISTDLEQIIDTRDTIYHSKEISRAVHNTTVSQVNFGFSGGINFRFGQFDLEGRYRLISPYHVSNDLGSYRSAYHTFQVGVAYRFR